MKVTVFVNEKKRNSQGMMPVSLRITADDGVRFLLSTGMSTPKKFSGMEFPRSDSGWKVKSMMLSRMYNDIMGFGFSHKGMPGRRLKEELPSVIGTRNGKRNLLCERMREFAGTKRAASTRSIYLLTADKVESFDASATFESVDVRWLREFEDMCRKTMSVNGTAIQLRNIRAVFNWAINNEWTEKYPFRRFKVRQEIVAIRNISVETLARFRDWNVDPWQEIYRDLFMLSFYLCGVNAGDLLLCRGLTNGRFVYHRKKTGRLYDLPVYDEALHIINKWRGKEYLLCPMDSYGNYLNFLHHWNDALKKIGTQEIVPDKTGRRRKIIYHPLVDGMTTYTARYTFASVCAELDIPRETIALCLGHSWSDVTARYLAYDKRKKVDEAVRRVIDYVNGVKG